jgi:hypothetical protein
LENKKSEDIAMFTHVLCLSAVIVGINVGWQPLQEGGMEYIIQLDPQSLEALKSGEPIRSDVLPGAGDVRSYKIILGTEKPPRICPPATSAQAWSAKTADREAAHSSKLPESTIPDRKSPFPRTLMPDPAQKPLTASSAAYNVPADGSAKSEAGPQNQSQAKKEEPAKPWMPLILVSLGLFASLGGNVYLTWIFADLRRRCRASISKAGQTASYT